MVAKVWVLFSPIARTGRTTLAVHLAWLMRKHGRRLLVCDLDVKADAALCLSRCKSAITPFAVNQVGLLSELLLADKADRPVAIRRTDFDLLRLGTPLAISDIDPAVALLKNIIGQSEGKCFYDDIIVDLSADFGVSQTVAFLLADTVVAPVQLNERAIASARACCSIAADFSKRAAVPIQMMIVPSMVNEMSPVQRAAGQGLTGLFNGIVTAPFVERPVFVAGLVDGEPFWEGKGVRRRKERLDEIELVFAKPLETGSS